jgi:hypothetical protein
LHKEVRAHFRRMGTLLIGDSRARFGAPFGHLRQSGHPSAEWSVAGRSNRSREQAIGRLAQNDRVRDPADLGTLGSARDRPQAGITVSGQLRRRFGRISQVTCGAPIGKYACALVTGESGPSGWRCYSSEVRKPFRFGTNKVDKPEFDMLCE